MEFGKRIADLWHVMSGLREELNLLPADRVVTRGDLKKLVSTVQQIHDAIEEASADAAHATAMELEDLVRVRRAAETLGAEVDQYVKATL